MDVQLHTGNCLHILKTLPAQSVQTCVTSPPYFGLRDYQTATWEGGDPECDHKPSNTPAQRGIASSTLDGGQASNGHKQEGYRDTCLRCGARRVDDQIGLEETPDQYVAKLVEVFREVRRVLRDDGTLWLNLGDSYASGCMSGKVGPNSMMSAKQQRNYGTLDSASGKRRHASRFGLKPKDLIGIPWRVAFALQADGWWLRSDIIWHKPNSLPESVRDRPTKTHEYIFLLTKSARYYYDADAIREPHSAASLERAKYPFETDHTKYNKARPDTAVGDLRNGSNPLHANGRNKRSVWTVTTKPFKAAHFATYPPDLIEPCVLAGTSAKGECSVCGAPWVRVVERSKYEPEVVSAGTRAVDDSRGDKTRKLSGSDYNKSVKVLNESWQPSCTCNADIVPQTVLDPFAGSGTTGYVALTLGRRFVGIELNPDYMRLIERRLSQAQLPLLEATP